MKAIKQIDKILSDNTLFLKNKFNLEITEINKNYLIYTGFLNSTKCPTKVGF